MIKRRSNSDKVNVASNSKSPKERPMNALKYIGMDVHKAITVIVVLNSQGEKLTEALVKTTSEAILDFIHGQRGTLHVVFEEGTYAAWMYDLIRPHVANVVVCDPRKIVNRGIKNDKIDAKLLAELLRTNSLTPVYHGEHSTTAVKELVRSYNGIVQDGTRIKNRLKAIFRGRGIDCSGEGVYKSEERENWLDKLEDQAVRARAKRLLEQLESLDPLRDEAEKELLAEARKHADTKVLRSAPGIGPLRAAVILGIAGTPHRFRTRKQFWTYCGLSVITKASSEYELINGNISKSKKRPLVRGLNRNYNRVLKSVFKGAAKTAAAGQWKSRFSAMIENGTPESLARLTLARKIAAITLALWKRGERYDPQKMTISSHAA
jgi:transposase